MNQDDAVLILGAGGFIGRHLAKRMSGQGVPVVAATRHPTDFDHPLVKNVASAFIDAASFRPLLSNCTKVIHVASITTPGSSMATPQIDGNLRTTLALLEAMQDTPDTRLVFLSSAGTIYGNRTIPAKESDSLLPRSYHGAGKAAAEQFIHAWAVQFAGTGVVLRASNVYGPGQRAREGFAIVPTAMECARTGTTLQVLGDGTQIRDYLFIDDLVRACVLTLSCPMPHGTHAYNVASGHGTSLNALLTEIELVAGTSISRTYTRARAVDVERILIDASAAHDALGWKPSVELHEGLARTWEWLQGQS